VLGLRGVVMDCEVEVVGWAMLGAWRAGLCVVGWTIPWKKCE